jgi:hypothetical protein
MPMGVLIIGDDESFIKTKYSASHSTRVSDCERSSSGEEHLSCCSHDWFYHNYRQDDRVLIFEISPSDYYWYKNVVPWLSNCEKRHHLTVEKCPHETMENAFARAFLQFELQSVQSVADVLFALVMVNDEIMVFDLQNAFVAQILQQICARELQLAIVKRTVSRCDSKLLVSMLQIAVHHHQSHPSEQCFIVCKYKWQARGLQRVLENVYPDIAIGLLSCEQKASAMHFILKTAKIILCTPFCLLDGFVYPDTSFFISNNNYWNRCLQKNRNLLIAFSLDGQIWIHKPDPASRSNVLGGHHVYQYIMKKNRMAFEKVLDESTRMAHLDEIYNHVFIFEEEMKRDEQKVHDRKRQISERKTQGMKK